MTPAQAAITTKALDFARERVRGALSSIVDAAILEAEARRAHPHRWALVHRYLAQHLPRWRMIARAHHRAMARRYGAQAWALDTLEGCSGAALAKALGLDGAHGPR